MSISAQPSPVLEIRELEVTRNEQRVLQVDHLEVQNGETLVVIGPNGAGKSTLLLVLARLLHPAKGQIFFRGSRLTQKEDLVYRRRIALVLQDPLLMDTSVFNNVAAGLRFRGQPYKTIKSQVAYWLDRFGISHLAERPSHKVSGGEAQRISLARAFALKPEVLLLDEPFRALDAPTRAQLQDDFQTLLAETEMTSVFVTHDMDEALLLGDRVAVILNGKLRQIGSPEQVFNNPADLDVASLVGVETVMSGRVISAADGQVVVDVCGLPVEAVGTAKVGQEVLLLVRPEDVTLWMGENLPVSSARNFLSGRVIRMTPHGVLMRVVIECQGLNQEECVQVIALITRTSGRQMGLAEGGDVSLTFKASAVHLIPRKT